MSVVLFQDIPLTHLLPKTQYIILVQSSPCGGMVNRASMLRQLAPIIFTFLAVLHSGSAVTNVVDILEFAKGGRKNVLS